MLTLTYAEQKLIPPGTNDPVIIPAAIALHRAASNAHSLYGYFDGPSDGIESHLYVRLDGTVEQYRTFNREADAQAGGNSWIGLDGKRYGTISIETEDLDDRLNLVPEWNPAQVATLRRIIADLSGAFHIPLHILRVEHPADASSGGTGWHSEFPSWNPNHHDCPGAARVAQIQSLLTTAPEEDIVASLDDLKTVLESPEVLDAQVRRLLGTSVGNGKTVAQALAAGAAPAPAVDASDVANALAANPDFLGALAKAVNDDAAQRLAQ